MKISNNFSGSIKGVLFACSSALGVTLVYLCSRLLTATMTTELLLFWWFALASVWSAIALLSERQKVVGFTRVIRSHFRFFCLYMLLESAATLSFFFVIRFVNPAIVSFFDILAPLFVTVIAFFYLKEKLKKIEIFGGILSICGVAVLTYVSPEVKPKFLMLIVMQVLFYSTSSSLAKKKNRAIPPLVITCFRVFCLSAICVLQILWKGGVRWPSARELFFLATGSAAGPVLGAFCFFSAMKYIKVTKIFLIKNAQPFLVALASTLLLKIPLSMRQLAGGMIIVVGISFVVAGKTEELKLYWRRLAGDGK